MARGRGGRGRGGRRGGRSRSRGRSSSKSKSRKRSTRRRSTAASKRRRVRSVAKAKRAANRSTTSKSTTKTKRRRVRNIRKTLKQKISAAGLNKKKTEKKTISASASRKQVRQKTKDKIATRKKISIGDALGRLTRPRGAYASSVQSKPKSKLQRQLSNLRKDIAQKSTKEARFNRRADRLKRQFGLDTRDMRDLKLNVNMDTILRQKLKIPGTNIKIGLNDRLRKALPKSIRNFRTDVNLGGKFRSPHKLGVRDGYRAPNRGGQTIAANTRQQLYGLRADPSQDIGMMYQNILGREADQEGLDYWTNEFRSGRQNMDDIRKQLVRSDEFGGRSDADKRSALRGLKQRRAARGEKVGVSRMIEEMNKRGIRHSKTGSPPRRFPDTKVALPYFPDGAPVPGGQDDRPGLIPLPDRRSKKYRRRPIGPQQDWLGSLYSRHNISGGKLDQEARDYWSNEIKTKGHRATRDAIIGTAKSQGTYGGRKRPQRINTGPRRRFPQGRGLGPISMLGTATRNWKGKRKQVKGARAKSLASTIAGIRGGLG